MVGNREEGSKLESKGERTLVQDDKRRLLILTTAGLERVHAQLSRSGGHSARGGQHHNGDSEILYLQNPRYCTVQC